MRTGVYEINQKGEPDSHREGEEVLETEGILDKVVFSYPRNSILKSAKRQ